MSALFDAGRHEELIALLDKAPFSLWHYRKWGVEALVATGRKAEAIHIAEASRVLNDNPVAIVRACEEILLSSSLAGEAHTRYAIAANQGATFLATFRAIAKKYPTQVPAKILDDLVASTPGQEGKWFAAAKDAGLYDEAIALAQRTPCDARTLTRAARDFAAAQPGSPSTRALPPCAGLPPAMATRSRELTYSPRARAPWLPPGTVDGSTRSRAKSVHWSPVRGQPPRTSLPRRLGHERSRDVQARTCEGRSTAYDRRSHPPHG